jgi:hypothetical protein
MRATRKVKRHREIDLVAPHILILLAGTAAVDSPPCAVGLIEWRDWGVK